jgi:prepilin-type processing-associated H-X9-DG protein
MTDGPHLLPAASDKRGETVVQPAGGSFRKTVAYADGHALLNKDDRNG